MTLDIGNRMKRYEDSFRFYLPPRQPVIMRVDGKAFHRFTAGCQKPFDEWVVGAMNAAACGVLREVQNARFAYTQSDEVSLLLIDYNTYGSQQWFGGNLQKMVSVAASAASVWFTDSWTRHNPYSRTDVALFDARAFILPPNEVCNYFIWRQQDATRNAIQMVARAHFSHKECLNKSCDELQEMLWQRRDINFNDIETQHKRGRVVLPDGQIDNDIPIFTQDRLYVERFLEVKEG